MLWFWLLLFVYSVHWVSLELWLQHRSVLESSAEREREGGREGGQLETMTLLVESGTTSTEFQVPLLSSTVTSGRHLRNWSHSFLICNTGMMTTTSWHCKDYISYLGKFISTMPVKIRIQKYQWFLFRMTSAKLCSSRKQGIQQWGLTFVTGHRRLSHGDSWPISFITLVFHLIIPV